MPFLLGKLMSIATLLKLAIIVALAGVLAFLMAQLITLKHEVDSSYKLSVMQSEPLFAKVIRYTRDIHKGTIIDPSMLVNDTLEIDRLPCGALNCENAAVGRETTRDVLKGELAGTNDLGFSDYKGGTNSIAESKKFGLFIGVPEFAPRQFKWNDRTVQIEECWLESCWSGHMSVPDKNYNVLQFKANVLGEPQTSDSSPKLKFAWPEATNDEYADTFIDFAEPSQSGAIRYALLYPNKSDQTEIKLQVRTEPSAKRPSQKVSARGAILVFRLPRSKQ